MRKILTAVMALALYLPIVAKADMSAVPYVAINGHQVTIGGTSAASTTPSAVGVDVLRAVCSAACYVAIAASGQAVIAYTPSVTATTSVYLPANTPEYFRIGSRSKIAVIKFAAATGTLFVTEMSK